MPGRSSFSASSWAVVRRHERSAQQEHAALTRGRAAGPRSRSCRSGSRRRRESCARRPACPSRPPEPAGDDLEIGVRLGVGHDDRRAAARERRPDRRSDRVATARPPGPRASGISMPSTAASRPSLRSSAQRARRASPYARAPSVAYSVRCSGTRAPSRSSRWTPSMVTRPAAGSAGTSSSGTPGDIRRDRAPNSLVLLPHVTAQRAVAAQQQARGGKRGARRPRGRRGQRRRLGRAVRTRVRQHMHRRVAVAGRSGDRAIRPVEHDRDSGHRLRPGRIVVEHDRDHR